MPRKKKEQSLSLVPKATIDEAVEGAEVDLKGLAPLPKRIEALKMTTDRNFQIVMEEGKSARNIERAVLARQKKLTSLCDNMKREIKSLFEPMLSACTEVLGLVDKKRCEYDSYLMRKQEVEQRRADEKAEAERKRLQRNADARAKRVSSEAEASEIRRSVEEVEVKQVEREAPAQVVGVSVAKIWDYEIVDEREVPEFFEEQSGDCGRLWVRKFERVELLRICREMMGSDNSRPQPIPGVRFFQKDSTRYGGG